MENIENQSPALTKIMTSGASELTSSALPVYTIGVASRLTDTSVHALRMYEDKGLIIPSKTGSGRRMYSKSDIERIRCIRTHLDEEGLNIAGIRSLLALIPCWLLRPCSEKSRQMCDAYTNKLTPCWEAETKASECQGVDCRTCDVYLLGGRCGDIKSLWKQVYETALTHNSTPDQSIS